MRFHAALDRVLGQQAGSQQHPRVRGIGAGSDGRDRDVAMADVTDRRIGDGIARHEPGSGLVVATLRDGFGKELRETTLDVLEIDAILGLLRAGYARASVSYTHLRAHETP